MLWAQQESNQLHALAEANALIVVPDGPGAEDGQSVEVLLLDPGSLSNVAGPALEPCGCHTVGDPSGTGLFMSVPESVSLPVPVRRSRTRAGSGAMPSTGDLVDRHGRVHRDLRISVTDRCNLRCVYCMPEDGLPAMPRHDLLTFDEITRLARVARQSGVTSVRITGGEPLVRRGLPGLVARLSWSRIRRLGLDHQWHGAGGHGERTGCGWAPTGQRQL